MPPRNTKEIIKQACLKLLDEKPMSQISVRTIVNECGINRNSFYYHYADIPALLNEIVMESADRIILSHAKTDSLEDCLAAATEFARENKRAVLHVFKSVNRGIYEQNLAAVCHDLVTAYCKTVFEGETDHISQEDKDAILRYYQCELMGQILLWLENDMRYDIQRQFARMCKLREGFALQMIERCRNADSHQ